MRRLDLEGASMGFAEVTEALRRNPQHTREALNIVVSCLYATKNSAAFVQFAIRRYIAAAVTIQRLVRKTIASMRADIYRELSRWIAHDQEASDAIIQRAVDGSRTPQESRHPDSADEAFLHFDIHLRQEVVEIFYKKQRYEFRGKLREWGEQLQRLRAEEASAKTDLANRVRNAETNQSNEMSMRGEMSRVSGASWLQGGTHGVEGSLRLLGLSGLEDGGNGMGVPPIIASLEELVTSIQTKIYRHKQRRPRFEFSVVFSDLRALAQERYTEAAGRRVAAVMGHLGISGDADVPQEQPSPYSSPKRRPRPSSATRMSIEFNEMFDNRSSGNSPTHHSSMKRPHYSPRQSFSASTLNHALYTSVLARSEMLKDTKGPRTSSEVGGGWGHSHTSPSTPRTPSRPHPEPRVPMGSALADGLVASKAGISSSAKRCYASLGLSLDVLQPVNTSTSHVSSVKHLTPEPAGYDEDGMRNSVVDRYAYLMEGRGDDECGESLQAPPASFKWQAGSRRQTFPHAPSSARIVRQSIYEPTAQTSQPASTAPSKISRTSSVVSSVLAPSRPSASRDAPRRRVMSAVVGSRTVVVAADAPQVSVVRPSHTLLNARDLVLAEEADARAHKMAASTHNFIASPRTNKAAILREELRYHREWPLKPPSSTSLVGATQGGLQPTLGIRWLRPNRTSKVSWLPKPRLRRNSRCFGRRKEGRFREEPLGMLIPTTWRKCTTTIIFTAFLVCFAETCKTLSGSSRSWRWRSGWLGQPWRRKSERASLCLRDQGSFHWARRLLRATSQSVRPFPFTSTYSATCTPTTTTPTGRRCNKAPTPIPLECCDQKQRSLQLLLLSSRWLLQPSE